MQFIKLKYRKIILLAISIFFLNIKIASSQRGIYTCMYGTYTIPTYGAIMYAGLNCCTLGPPLGCAVFKVLGGEWAYVPYPGPYDCNWIRSNGYCIYSDFA